LILVSSFGFGFKTKSIARERAPTVQVQVRGVADVGRSPTYGRPISASSESAVTGPTMCFTTLPSGPISHVVGSPCGSSKSFGGLSSVTCETG